MAELSVLRDDRILGLRGPRNAVDPRRPYAHLLEPERTREGLVENVATVFITNRECPFRCLMCDLWKNTTLARVPEGAVAEQVEWALARLGPTPHVKLYNSGNFFDQQAISRHDRLGIAAQVRGFRTVIVESHPKLVGKAALDFAGQLGGRLDVAMGLETVDPAVLPRLNKRMTLADYERAARFLVDRGIGVRAFILLRAPYQDEVAGVAWAKRSLEWAFSIGVECCVIIPTRGGNGAMEWLEQAGQFAPPALDALEAVLEYGIGLNTGRVFADLWDANRLNLGKIQRVARLRRLEAMNFSQSVPARCPVGGRTVA